MVVSKTVAELLPVAPSMIDRYRQFAAEECSRALSSSIQPRRYFTRREIVVAHRLVELMVHITQNKGAL